MLASELRSEKDKIINLFTQLEKDSNCVDIRTLSVFANHMAIRSAGFVEKSIQVILEEYCKNRANKSISKFVRKTIERENSLNCEKIEKILERFDESWWSTIKGSTSVASKEAVDSLKTIRDQLAHGNHNGTGLAVIKQYFGSSVKFIEVVSDVILQEN